MGLFLTLQKEGRTILIVTRDTNIAAYFQRTIHLLDGRIVCLLISGAAQIHPFRFSRFPSAYQEDLIFSFPERKGRPYFRPFFRRKRLAGIAGTAQLCLTFFFLS